MSKRRIFLVVIAGVAFAGTLAAIVNRRSEPEYEGKKLSEWVDILYKARSGDRRVPAEKALQEIGTNALPFLLDWAAYETPEWRKKVYRVVYPKIRRLRPSWQLVDRRAVRALASEDALMDLGPFGEAEIAALAALLRHQDESGIVALRAESILASFGTNGLPPLICVLTNDQSPNWLRFKILVDIPYYYSGTNAPRVIPALRQILRDRDPMVRDMAREDLQTIAPKELSADARARSLE